MKSYKWVVEIEVDASWVADGFELTDERAHGMVAKTLPYAYNYEFSAKVIKSPSKESILKEQGYEPQEIAHKVKP